MRIHETCEGYRQSAASATRSEFEEASASAMDNIVRASCVTILTTLTVWLLSLSYTVLAIIMHCLMTLTGTFVIVKLVRAIKS